MTSLLPLYESESGLSVSTCVVLADNGVVSYEIEPDNDRVMFSFGYRQDYMLDLRRGALNRMIELGAKALAELDRAQAEDDTKLPAWYIPPTADLLTGRKTEVHTEDEATRGA